MVRLKPGCKHCEPLKTRYIFESEIVIIGKGGLILTQRKNIKTR